MGGKIGLRGGTGSTALHPGVGTATTKCKDLLRMETSKRRGLQQDFPAADSEGESCEAQGVNVSQRATGG